MAFSISAAVDVSAAPPSKAPRFVALFAAEGALAGDVHERACQHEAAKRVAHLLGLPFEGLYASAAEPSLRYFVPTDTLGPSQAAALGIADVDDLYGGVVPFPFAATKVITHPIIDDNAATPDGWSHDFPARVERIVLRGFSAFSADDAFRAGDRLLAAGPVRAKPARARAGQDQFAVSTRDELARWLRDLAPHEIAHGLVLEENLRDATTFSVGTVRLRDASIAYYGRQRLTRDNNGALVYGGTDIFAVPGDLCALLPLRLPADIRTAVNQATAYDLAAAETFEGLILSRRNYDMIAGTAADGSHRSGVLEQAWRIGGATGAEIAALEAFHADPSLQAVEASTFERYGRHAPPQDAAIYYAGDDPRIGPVAKYARIVNRWL